MPVFNRRRIAIALLILGLIALGIGLWVLIGLLWPKNTPAEPETQPREVQVVQREVHQPQTLALPINVQGTTTAEQVQGAEVPTVQEAVRRAESVVSRMGSGTSQDGFLGYDDVMIDGTPRFRNWVSDEQVRMRSQYPKDGPLYGMTTRIVSSDVAEGTAGSSKIIIRIQAQKTEDAGDRSTPTAIIYEQADVTCVKQNNGIFLIDEVIIIPIKP